MPIRRKKTVFTLLCLPALFAAGLTLYLNLSGRRSIHIPCLWAELLNFACPFCGATRATCAVLTLRFTDALKYNALYVPTFFTAAGVYIYNMYKTARFGRFIRLNKAALITAAVAWAAFTALRNLPFYPYGAGFLK